jgi:hypothetical protein
MNKNLKRAIGCMLIIVLMYSFTTVNEYQKNRLNDSEMQLSARRVQKTELDFQSIREGAAGANGGKTGGGCGCN